MDLNKKYTNCDPCALSEVPGWVKPLSLFYDPLERVGDQNHNKARLNFLPLSGTRHTESEWFNLEKVVCCLLYPTRDVSSTKE